MPGTLRKTSSSQRADAVLESSFTFIPGVGSKTEEQLWNDGIFTWDDAITKLDSITRIGRSKRDSIRSYLTKAVEALERSDVSFFANNFPKSDHWRLFDYFPNNTVFLDIETSGLSLYYDYITLVGAFDGHSNTYFIKDHNLSGICEHLSNYQIIATFNGTNFDIPFLKKEFPQIHIPPIHIDLRYLLRSVGVSGPLKTVEKNLGIQRPSDLRELSGRDAVVLWRRFTNGDDDALRTLLLYNAFDTANLVYLLDYCRNMRAAKITSKMQAATYQIRMGETPRVPQCATRAPVARRRVSPNTVVKRIDDDIFEIRSGKQKININRRAIKKPEIKIEEILDQLQSNQKAPVSIGIDLSGSEERPSGVCVLRGREAHLDMLETDAQLLSLMQETRPSVVSIDSPLSLPKGRCCSKDSCQCRQFGITRECERTLKKRGINVYPCLIPSMQSLTTRGMRIAALAEQHGLHVIESYPGAAQDILGLPRKRVDLEGLQTDLTNMGIKAVAGRSVISHHEIDALTSALVGYFYLIGRYESLGNVDEGYLIIPSIQTSNRERNYVEVAIGEGICRGTTLAPTTPDLGKANR